MSTKRHGWLSWWGEGKRPRGLNGEKLCCMCPKPVQKPHIEYCSDQCVVNRRIMTNASFARMQVFGRDKGVCRACGFDTERWTIAFLKAMADDVGRSRAICVRCRMDNGSASGRVRDLRKMPNCGDCGSPCRAEIPLIERRPLIALLREHGYGDHVAEQLDRATHSEDIPHLWEADHVVAVVEGGGQCGLDGLRTLCLPCHRAETAALAKRRAINRKLAERHPSAPPRLRRG